jgi:hypothetical protein
MKSTPILAKPYLGDAITKGHKWMTRRAITRLFRKGTIWQLQKTNVPDFDWSFYDFEMLENVATTQWLLNRCPYGQAGDELWFKERWFLPHRFDHLKVRELPEGAKIGNIYHGEKQGGLVPRTSMFMPRWAARSVRTIKSVRIERLGDISDADCVAEGCSMTLDSLFLGAPDASGKRLEFDTPRDAFASVWDGVQKTKGAFEAQADEYFWCIEWEKS